MSLDLDKRQRAMLHEMGVPVWWPASLPAELPAESIVAGAAPAVTAVSAMASEMAPASARAATPAGDVAAMDGPSLAQTIAACQACRLCSGRRAPVFSASAVARRADCFVLGEPPDETEERLGLPFAGQAGQLLDNMLRAIKLGRSDASTPAQAAYLSNVVKCRPAVARNPELQELAACEIYLQRELALVQPTVILALGRFAAQVLLQASVPEVASIPLGKLRGKIYSYRGIPVVVCYHPVYLLRTPQDKARAWADLCLVLDLLKPEAARQT